MKKRMTMFALCGLLCFASNLHTFAAEFSTNHIADVIDASSSRMSCITAASCYLAPIGSNGIANFSCSVNGANGTVTRVAVQASLQQYKNGQWITLKTFSKDVNASSVDLTQSYKVSKGYTYRVSARINAYSASSSEGKTITSSSVSY